MEMTQLLPADRTLVEQDSYSVSSNGGKVFKINSKMSKPGLCNVLLDAVEARMYDAKKHTFEESQKIFMENGAASKATAQR